MSSPRSQQLEGIIDRILEAHPNHSNVELGASLGVDESYVRKLRDGWRPSRVREELWHRLKAADPESKVTSPGSAEFYDGVLFAAQAMSETVTRLLAEARIGLARPTRAEANVLADRARAALEAVAASEEAKAARARRRA